MASFRELVDEVIDTTRRADKWEAIKVYVNRAQNRIVRDAAKFGQFFQQLLMTTEFRLEANKYEVVLAGEVHNVSAVWWKKEGTEAFTQLGHRTALRFDVYAGKPPAKGDPKIFKWTEHNKITIALIPTTAGILLVDWYRWAKPMERDSDLPEIAHYDDIIVADAVGELYDGLGMVEESVRWTEKYNRLMLNALGADAIPDELLAHERPFREYQPAPSKDVTQPYRK